MAVGNAIIGALRVVIGADSAALDKGLKQSQKSLDDFGASAAKGAAVAAGAMVAAFGAITVGISSALKEMDGFAKQSQKIGIPVEELSRLKLAADLSDVSMQQLGTGLGKLSKAMVEAAAKPTSQAANAFAALGVKVTDAHGALRPTSEVLADIAGRFAGAKDGAAKTAIAMALFGKAGAELIPLLNAGKTGLKEMMDEAEKLGIVIDTKTAKSAEAFRDNLTRLGAVKDAIFIKISAQLLPVLERLSAAFVESAKEGNAAEVAAKGIGGTMLELAKHVESTVFFVGRLGETWAALKTLISEPLNLTANWTAFKDVLAGTAQGVRDIHFTYTAFGETLRETANTLAGYTKIATDAAEGGQKDLNFKVLGGKDAFDKYLDSVSKSTEATKADAQAVGALTGFQESLRVVMQGQEVARQNNLVLGEKERQDLQAKAIAAGNAKLQLEGLNLAYANREPIVAYQDAMEQTRLKLEAVGATSETIGRAQNKVAEQFGMAWSNIGTSIASTFGVISQATVQFAKENKALGVASKVFGIAQAIINTQIAVTKALALLGPTPAGYAAAGLAIATGAASIATIAAQSFASGGSFKIPGGMGGGDKVFAPMMLEPGEQVDIWRPGQGGRDPRGGGNQVTVRVDPGPIPREWVESLIRGLNEAIGDGHRLKLA